MLNKKTFTDVLMNNNNREDKVMKEEATYVPLKPITNPKVIRGDAVVELDFEEYQRGTKKLKFCAIRSLSLYWETQCQQQHQQPSLNPNHLGPNADNNRGKKESVQRIEDKGDESHCNG